MGNAAALSLSCLLPPLWLAGGWSIVGRPACPAEVVLDLVILPGEDSGVDVRPPEASSGLLEIHLDMESLTELNWKDIID